MAISEMQLTVWSNQGSISQSRSTYSTVKGILEDRTAQFADKSFEIFLQGSYGNDTNIYADSDVDVVIKLNSVYYYENSGLNATQKAKFDNNFSPATYSYSDFKNSVIQHLRTKFGSDVQPGNKAIFIKGNGSRRDSDVLVAAQYRKYISYDYNSSRDYIEGICFWDINGNQIINYPKQHLENCTNKHQSTSSYFKPMIRVLKNMRNNMILKNYIDDSIAPSYFLEGLLYNVPNDKFGRSYADTFVNAINWLTSCETSQLVCANEQYFLVNPYSLVTWRVEKLNQYLDAAIRFWKEY